MSPSEPSTYFVSDERTLFSSKNLTGKVRKKVTLYYFPQKLKDYKFKFRRPKLEWDTSGECLKVHVIYDSEGWKKYVKRGKWLIRLAWYDALFGLLFLLVLAWASMKWVPIFFPLIALLLIVSVNSQSTPWAKHELEWLNLKRREKKRYLIKRMSQDIIYWKISKPKLNCYTRSELKRLEVVEVEKGKS